MLQEVHHRVKNNLQVIASIINLQAARLDNPEMVRIFNDLRSRIHSMASVHEQLYREERFSEIEFAQYIKTICGDLFRLYSIKEGQVELELNVDTGAIALDQAVPCALMLNELITNSLKHAFTDDRQGLLSIDFCFDTDRSIFVLSVKDNGVGFPEGYKPKESTTLGMTLVNALTSQLDGTIEIESKNGTSFVIEFPALT